MIQELVRRTTLVVVLFPVGVSFSFLLCLDIRVFSSWFQWPNTFFHFFIFLRTQSLLILDLLWIALSVIQFMPLQVSDLREDGHAVATGEPFLFPGLSRSLVLTRDITYVASAAVLTPPGINTLSFCQPVSNRQGNCAF